MPQNKNAYLELEEKRIKSLFGAFWILSKHGDIDSNRFTLNRSLLKLVVSHYLKDLHLLKERYGIKDKVQPQKVAGLTTAAVMRFRPVLPKNGSDENLFNGDENEVLAIFHGLCMCAERGNGKIDMQLVKSLMSKSEFPEWLANFIYLLKFREYTAESLAMVFDALIKFVE
jgi:hypothetical protein